MLQAKVSTDAANHWKRKNLLPLTPYSAIHQPASMICIQRTFFTQMGRRPTIIGGFVSHLSLASHHLMNSQSMEKADKASSILPIAVVLHYTYKQLVEMKIFQVAQKTQLTNKQDLLRTNLPHSTPKRKT